MRASRRRRLRGGGCGGSKAADDSISFPSAVVQKEEEDLRKSMDEATTMAAVADWSELTDLGGGCEIGLAELCGITCVQLRAVIAHIKRRCEAEGWKKDQQETEQLSPGKVNLHDCLKYVVRPFTIQRRCAFVEMVARSTQSPRWFVSHWWGEPLVNTVACLARHSADYGTDAAGEAVPGGTSEDTPYWVCAFAINQWARGDELNTSPGNTAFHRAMSLSEGTLSILDKEGRCFSRLWPCHEVHVTLNDVKPHRLASGAD